MAVLRSDGTEVRRVEVNEDDPKAISAKDVGKRSPGPSPNELESSVDILGRSFSEFGQWYFLVIRDLLPCNDLAGAYVRFSHVLRI